MRTLIRHSIRTNPTAAATVSQSPELIASCGSSGKGSGQHQYALVVSGRSSDGVVEVGLPMNRAS